MNKHTSNTVRLNITLPKALGERLKSSGNRSGLIAESLRQKFAQEDKEKLNAILRQAYADSAKEDRQIAKEWESTLGDGL